MKHWTNTIVSGCFVMAITGPASGQAGEDPEDENIDQRIDRAVNDLFQDLQLQFVDEDEPIDPRDQIIRDRKKLEELQQRLIQLQLDQRGPAVFDLERAAEPVQLNAKERVDPWADRNRDDIVLALNHEEFAVRESAQASLLTDNTLTKEDLKAMIQSAESPEQRRRLVTIAEHHVLRAMRERDFGQPKPGPGELPIVREAQPAAVGYSYEPILADENPHADLPGVQVIATMPGFPGYAHLRRGDIIVQINGQGLSNHHREHDITNWVRWQISSRSAGDTIDFALLRDGEMIAVKMVCAEGLALDHMYTTDAFEAAARKQPYKKAWNQVRDQLVAAMPRPKTLTPKAVVSAE